MIRELAQYYDSAGELVVRYDPRQREIYLKATSELWEAATSEGLKHHSAELYKARDEIQKRYRKLGLELDLFPLPKGTHKGEGNVTAMILKRFLKEKGFQVLVSEEDYYLLSERGHHYTNKGYGIISKIFGEYKVERLLSASQGGDPDIFAYLSAEPKKAWFIEAKRMNEKLTPKQAENFPYIREYLCPVEIARIIPLPTATYREGARPMTTKTTQSPERKSTPAKDVTAGIELMRKAWILSGKKITENQAGSIAFIDPVLGIRGRVAFRIELDQPTPLIAIYSGENDPERGSPLLKPHTEDKKKRLQQYGFTLPVRTDWEKRLDKTTKEQFYKDFIQHALETCKGAKK
jgi:hypothetical protein